MMLGSSQYPTVQAVRMQDVMALQECHQSAVIQQLNCSHNPGVEQQVRELAVTRGNSKDELNIKQIITKIVLWSLQNTGVKIKVDYSRIHESLLLAFKDTQEGVPDWLGGRMLA